MLWEENTIYTKRETTLDRLYVSQLILQSSAVGHVKTGQLRSVCRAGFTLKGRVEYAFAEDVPMIARNGTSEGLKRREACVLSVLSIYFGVLKEIVLL